LLNIAGPLPTEPAVKFGADHPRAFVQDQLSLPIGRLWRRLGVGADLARAIQNAGLQDKFPNFHSHPSSPFPAPGTACHPF